MATIDSRTVVFITGAFVSHACWDHWRDYFEERGFIVMAPPWPGKNADAETLRGRHPDPVLAAVTIADVVGYYMSILSQLTEKPIVIGHSFGGLICQLLLNKGLVAAGVAIHPVPPGGIIPYEWRFLKSNFQALGYFTPVDKTYMISFRKWQDVFTNGMSLDEQTEAYYALAIPESKRAIRGTMTSAARIDFSREHQPLLLLAGSEDHCIPATLVKRTFHKYRSRYSVIKYVMKKRNHFVLGAPTWEQDADFIIGWLHENGRKQHL